MRCTNTTPTLRPLRACLAALALTLLSLAACGARSGRKGDVAGPTPARDGAPVADSGADAAPLSFVDQVLRACAIAASCNSAQPGSQALFSASACVDWFGTSEVQNGYAPSSGQLRQRLLACASRGADCRAFHACFGGELVTPSLCHEGATCVGSEVVDNIGPLASKARFDCKSLGVGWDCIDLPTGAPRACCVFEPSGAPCVPRCENTSRGAQCLFGATVPIDCAAAGLQCDTSVETLCRGRGAPCAASSATRCSGSRSTRCVGGREHRVDCAENPFRGSCDEGSSEGCVPAGGECRPSIYQGRCDGERLVVCADGSLTAVDCRAIGFEICIGPLGQRPARCSFLL